MADSRCRLCKTNYVTFTSYGVIVPFCGRQSKQFRTFHIPSSRFHCHSKNFSGSYEGIRAQAFSVLLSLLFNSRLNDELKWTPIINL